MPADFFQKDFFMKDSFTNTIRVSNSLDQIKPDKMSGLIWVQTVCKGYQQMVCVCFVALRPKSTAMVMAGQSVHLTTLFPGQA